MKPPPPENPRPSLLNRAIHTLRFMQTELLCAAVSNTWLVVALAWHVEPPHRQNPLLLELPPLLALLCAAAASAGLYLYGRALNDVMDSRHDRAFWPQRPIPAGLLRRSVAATIAVAGLLAAILAAIFLGRGPSLLCLATATAILFFNAAARFFPAVGLVLIGLIHAAGMLLPNPRLGFVWPVWLGMSHVSACSAIVYWLAGKRPRLRPGHLWALVAGWLFWSLTLIAIMDHRDSLLIHDHPWLAFAPTITVVFFSLFAITRLVPAARSPRSRRSLAGPFNRSAFQFLILYNAAWLLGLGLWPHALLHLALWTFSRFIPTTLDLLESFTDDPQHPRYIVTRANTRPPNNVSPPTPSDTPFPNHPNHPNSSPSSPPSYPSGPTHMSGSL